MRIAYENIIYQINEMNQNNMKTLKLLQKYWTWVTDKDWGTDESGIRIQVCTLKKKGISRPILILNQLGK